MPSSRAIGVAITAARCLLVASDRLYRIARDTGRRACQSRLKPAVTSDLSSRRLRHHAVAPVVLGAVERDVGAL